MCSFLYRISFVIRSGGSLHWFLWGFAILAHWKWRGDHREALGPLDVQAEVLWDLWFLVWSIQLRREDAPLCWFSIYLLETPRIAALSLRLRSSCFQILAVCRNRLGSRLFGFYHKRLWYSRSGGCLGLYIFKKPVVLGSSPSSTHQCLIGPDS